MKLDPRSNLRSALESGLEVAQIAKVMPIRPVSRTSCLGIQDLLMWLNRQVLALAVYYTNASNGPRNTDTSDSNPFDSNPITARSPLSGYDALLRPAEYYCTRSAEIVNEHDRCVVLSTNTA